MPSKKVRRKEESESERECEGARVCMSKCLIFSRFDTSKTGFKVVRGARVLHKISFSFSTRRKL